MLFKEVRLKKNGWHKKLQMKTFGWNADYQLPYRDNFCPYFWLTIFCIIIIPITAIRLAICFLYKSIILAMGYALDKIDTYICEPIYKSSILRMSDEDILNTYRLTVKSFYSPNRKDWQKWNTWKNLNPEDWKKRIKEIEDRAKVREAIVARKRKAASKKKAENKIKRQAMFNNIIKYTKYLTPVFLAGLGISALYAMYRLILLIGSWAKTWNLQAIGQMILVIVLIIVVILIIIFVGFLIKELFSKCTIEFSLFKKFRKVIASSFKFIFKPIGSFFSFIIEFIVAYKENNCPPIVWED